MGISNNICIADGISNSGPTNPYKTNDGNRRKPKKR